MKEPLSCVVVAIGRAVGRARRDVVPVMVLSVRASLTA
jgi:hypothetical protein